MSITLIKAPAPATKLAPVRAGDLDNLIYTGSDLDDIRRNIELAISDIDDFFAKTVPAPKLAIVLTQARSALIKARPAIETILPFPG